MDRRTANPSICSIFLPLTLAASATIVSPSLSSQEANEATTRLGKALAAYANDVELTFADLDELILWRHAQTQEGRAALREFLELRMLEALEKEERIEIGAKYLNARWEELDREVRASGVEGGLPEYLETSGVDRKVFQDFLRLSMVQEILARRAFGIPDDAPISGEQQTLWLEGVLEERGYEEEPHPWSQGVVARTGSFTIERKEFLEYLRGELPREALEEACHELMLERKIRARMPDVSEEAIARWVEEEIGNRRRTAEADPTYKGLGYEQLLKAGGLSLEALRRDPNVRVAALSRGWIERANTEQRLRDVYEAEREFFDGRFGEGVELYLILLKAARFKNDLNPRTFEEAEEELARIRARCQGVEDFIRLVRVHSEDANSRENGGLLGVVTRGSEGVPHSIRRETFSLLEQDPGDLSGRMVGPLRIQGACVLACLGARRPPPIWDDMLIYVRAELRRRFLDEVLPRQSMVTWLDA